YKINSRMLLSGAVRHTNSPENNFRNVWNVQSSFRYQIHPQYSFLVSLGKYSNFSYAVLPSVGFTFNTSEQASLDIKGRFSRIPFELSFYHNRIRSVKAVISAEDIFTDNGIPEQTIIGADLSTTIPIAKNAEWKSAVAFFSNKGKDTQYRKFKSSRDISPILRSNLTYYFSKAKISTTLSASYRNGKRYTPFYGVADTSGVISLQPGNRNSEQLPEYFRLDFNAYKIVSVFGRNTVLYTTISNITDNKNVSKIGYTKDFNQEKRYFSGRMFFIGMTVNLL
ncbi:MAG: hypothetical protein Q4G08_02465, partial [Capnocytophaga sp.]|nr:hypothetical protein [Capnocytophaga sp.]